MGLWPFGTVEIDPDRRSWPPDVGSLIVVLISTFDLTLTLTLTKAQTLVFDRLSWPLTFHIRALTVDLLDRRDLILTVDLSLDLDLWLRLLTKAQTMDFRDLDLWIKASERHRLADLDVEIRPMSMNDGCIDTESISSQAMDGDRSAASMHPCNRIETTASIAIDLMTLAENLWCLLLGAPESESVYALGSTATCNDATKPL
jgi:hypothetical protein